ERQKSLTEYREQYEAARGREYHGPAKPIHFVGSISGSQRRTRPRRMIAPAFFKQAQAQNKGRPDEPIPVPEKLTTAFIDAFWHSQVWRETRWLGRRVAKCPTDLVAYQELLAKVRPDWIIETRTGGGGRAWFLATVCEMLGHGQVISIDDRAGDKLPRHD